MHGLSNKKSASTKAAFLSSRAGLGSSQGLGLRPGLRDPDAETGLPGCLKLAQPGKHRGLA